MGIKRQGSRSGMSDWWVGFGACSLALLAGTATLPVEAKKPSVRNPEDLLVVDCLLPGQIRKLGAQATFMSARRPIRTTQADCEIRGGEYVAHDRANYQTALKVWMDQAMAGNAEAQNYVGEIYLKGLGTPPDYDMAAVWLKKAAEQGNNRARINLGYLYEQGLGVAQDRTRALNLYREAAGVQNDELLFASAVQVQLEARDSEIGALRSTVEQQRQESDQLRARVADLESQLARRRQALQTSQSELERLKGQLADARKATGADFGSTDRQRQLVSQRENEIDRLKMQIAEQRAAVERRERQLAQQEQALKAREQALAKGSADAADVAEIRDQISRLTDALASTRQRAEALQAQLLASQSILEQERQEYQAAVARIEQEYAARKQEDWQLMKLLETQLSQREAEVREQQMQIASLTQQVALGSGQLLAAAPTLEIVDPPLTLTRGRPAAMLRGPAGRQSMTGKVSNPQAVERITVNGTPVILGDNGLFRASVEVQPGGSLISIAAVDQRGAESTLEFMMLPQGQGSRAVAAGDGSPAASRLPSGVQLGRYHAIVIGNNSYQSGSFAPLQSAVNDATAVAQVLRDRYGYDARLLLNATRFQILSALNDAREALGPDDNLLVYYAGHGDLATDARQGYWIPTDGQPGMPNTWISNTAVSEVLETMKARHVLVVADSCYSGAMAGAAMPVANPAVAEGKWNEWVRTMASGRSRTALTSGGVQPVPDTGTGKHSFFARAFLNALEDNNRLLETQQLFREITSSLALAAVNAPVTQVPEYAPIQFAGHENGEFFFLPSAKGARTGP